MLSDRPILIIDGLNLFTRAYSAYPQMSSHGYQMGGCIGFMKTLQRLSREYSPSAIYVAWEGGGSLRRRHIFPEYKMNRRPEKLNRFYEGDIPDTDDNRKHQLISLLGALKNVPVCQIYVPDCEGDDVIAFLCRGSFRGRHKIVASSDKDMYQLLDDTTQIYSFHKRKIFTGADVMQEFRIRPHNFALAKAICGDPSDNIPGVKGIGFKTAADKFPFLGGDEEILLQDFINYAAAHSQESVIYKRVFECQEDVKRNWKLVHLDGSMLSADQTSRVERILSTFQSSVNKIGLIKCLVKEGIGDFDTDSFFYDFHCIDSLKYRAEK